MMSFVVRSLEGQPRDERSSSTSLVGFDQAGKDFDALNPSGLKDIPGGGRVGQLPDGRTAVVRPSSSGGAPTLEVQAGKNHIRIRYGN